MSIHRSVADAIGLLVLAVLAGFVAWLVAVVYGKEDAVWAWCLGFPVLAVCGLFAWHSEKWPTEPQDALIYALGSIFVGAAFFAIDAVTSTSRYPQLPFREAIWHAGSPFGIVLTIAICPCFTLVALAGAARALLVTKDNTSSTL
jgi:hypothetical protein